MFAAVACVGATNVWAQTSGNPGDVVCSKYMALAALSDPDTNVVHEWLGGYLSGLNALWITAKGTDPLKNVEPTQVKLYLMRYCDANPQMKVLDAANELFSTLSK
jgi:hypothetical protein